MPAEPPDARALVREAAAQLPGDTPRLDAELLLAHALGQERLEMLVRPDAIGPEVMVRFKTYLARRRRDEPVGYIVGQQEFWSLELEVSPAVLIPRPDSETLLEAAVRLLAQRPPGLVLDLGTGSGALLLAALAQWPGAYGVGVDRSMAALVVAKGNAARLGFGGRAAFVGGDWAAAIGGRFDLLLCNPPYVQAGADLMPDVAMYEPAAALFAGPDGLDAYRTLFSQIGRLLEPEGVALFEFGAGQETALQAMAAGLGFVTALFADLAGRPRALGLTVPAGQLHGP